MKYESGACLCVCKCVYVKLWEIYCSLTFSEVEILKRLFHRPASDSSLLSRNVKIKIYRIVSLPVVLCGCEISSLTLWEERRLRV
jgi:hypothetical protein